MGTVSQAFFAVKEKGARHTLPISPKKEATAMSVAHTSERGGVTLSAEHLRMLRDESGISEEVIRARGYRTVTDPRELAALNFAPSQRLTPGLLLPGHAPDGSNGFCMFRPDYPRQARSRGGGLSGKVVKYEFPKGMSMRLDCPPVCREKLADPSIPLWITEGQKKADALASHGLTAAAMLSVWTFKGRNEYGGVVFLADFDYIALNGRNVRIVFDSDVMFKPSVRQALDRITAHLQRKGAHVTAVYLPGGRDRKVGVDDYLLSHTVADLEALIDAPRPQPQPAPPTLELLDSPPLTIRRPLSLVEGRAYAAIWPHVRVTVRESVDKSGQLIKHDPPIVRDEQRLMIVRDDGAIFGDSSVPLSRLGFVVHLNEVPPAEKLWSTPGVKRFNSRERPDPADMFRHIVDVVDCFIDFDRSTASQAEMCEFIACYILSTWFLDAFNVAGFLWPNGERGSGKTQLLTLIAALGYLGQVILAGGSYASLRDLADYGAVLCFDDAENLADPKSTDPDKRTLLLAGNRRGNTVPVKEMRPDRTWRTRHVSTYCPRAFSAIRLPDPVLASRTIIVPLIRTADRSKANSDPLDDALWPHKRQDLLDELWALALTYLPRLPHYERRVSAKSFLTGRNLEPWRASLAVALWLDENGIKGLWQRMNNLSRKYQSERESFESGDLTPLVICALSKCCGVDEPDVSDVSDVLAKAGGKFISTQEITESVRDIAADIEADIDPDAITTRRIGWVLKKLRLRAGRNSARTMRGWEVTINDLTLLRRRYGINDHEKTSETSESGGEAPGPEALAKAESWSEE